MKHRPRTRNTLLEMRERLELLNSAIAALEQYELLVYGTSQVRRGAPTVQQPRLKLPVVLRRLGRNATADHIAARVESVVRAGR